MVGRIITRLGPAMALIAVAAASPAAAGGRGGGMGHGAVMMPAGGMHGGMAAFHGFRAGPSPRWGSRGLPPLSGVIHERPGMRSYMSGFGHTDTAARFGGFGGYGHTATALPRAGAGGRRFEGYGHTATALPALRAGARFGMDGRGFRRFAAGTGGVAARLGRDRFAFVRRGYGGYGVGGYGGYGVGGYGAGGYGFDDASAAAGSAGAVGLPGAYDAGVYGGAAVGTQAGTYGGPYLSEVPLAARFAEAPLAPSPGSAYSPDDAYAYAASADAGPGPRIVSVGRRDRGNCRCGSGAHVEPIVYRYGVGTAY